MATPKIDAYLEEVRHQNLRAEEKARHVGETPELLNELLRDTLTFYTKPYRDLFKGARFDFVGKRLVSKDGQYMLVWDLREYPGKPESYRNQQTSLGRVAFVRLLELYSRGV